MNRKAFLAALLATVMAAGHALADSGASEFSIVVNNVNNTNEEFWYAVERREDWALRRLKELASGGVLVRQGNAVVNRVTGQVTSTVGRQIDDAIDAAFSPVEDAIDSVGQTISCSVGGAILGTAAGAVSSVFSGGKSTYGGQLAQLLQQGASNACQGKQLATANLQLEELRNMNAGIGITDEGMLGQMDRSLPVMEQSGFLMTEPAIGAEIDEIYPNVFDSMTPDELIALDADLKQQGRQSHVLSFRAQNRMIQEQMAGIGRVAQHAAAGRAGDGIRAELQASNAIQGEMVASVNMLTNATVANHRAMTEVELRKETRTAAANKAADEFMSSLSRCDDCTMSKPLFRN